MKTMRFLLWFIIAFVGNSCLAKDAESALKAAQAGDYQTAFQLWLPLAEQGDARSQYNIGLLYANGTGVVQDWQQAAKWYHLSAAQGYASAQNNLGVLYEDGLGVIQDYDKALKWYRLSAEQGEVLGLYNVGYMYKNGYGLDKDHVYAHMWFNLSALLGDSIAADDMEILAKTMTAEQILQAKQLTIECVKKSYKSCD